MDSETKIEESDVVEINTIQTLPLTVLELGKATTTDAEVEELLRALITGKNILPKYCFGIDQKEFSLQSDCIMRGSRVYIPPILREKVLQELHSSHFGISRIKSLARSYCWWPNIDKDIENMVINCQSCQETRANPPKVPIHCWEKAEGPFQRVHVDYAGPFMGSYFFILVDAFSKWPEVRIVNNITKETTINTCRNIFSTFGVLIILVSDNGTQFSSTEFAHFLKFNGVIHKFSAPYHPATNGQAERFIQTFKAKLKAMKCGRLEIPGVLSNILMSYRKMIHPSTEFSPSMLVFGRQIRSRIDLMIPSTSTTSKEVTLKIKEFQNGQRVAAREYIKDNKWEFGKVKERLGKLHYLIELDDGRTWKRHIDQMRSVGNNPNSTNDLYIFGKGKDSHNLLSEKAIKQNNISQKVTKDSSSRSICTVVSARSSVLDRGPMDEGTHKL